MLYSLCAPISASVADIIAIIVLCIFAGVSAKKGFVKCIFGLLSTIIAIILASLLMKTFVRITGGLFGLEGVLYGSFKGTLEKVSAFAIDISSSGIRETMEQQNLPAFIIDLVVENIGNEMVAQGTTLATMIAQTVAEFATNAIAFLALFLIFKILFKILSAIISGIIEKLPVVSTVNSLLGFAVGVVQGLLVLSLVVLVLGLIPSFGSLITDGVIVGWLYEKNLIATILSWVLTL